MLTPPFTGLYTSNEPACAVWHAHPLPRVFDDGHPSPLPSALPGANYLRWKLLYDWWVAQPEQSGAVRLTAIDTCALTLSYLGLTVD